MLGTCVCATGFGGANCDECTCQNDCHGRGRCECDVSGSGGVCNCLAYGINCWTGEDCGMWICPSRPHDDPLTLPLPLPLARQARA